MEDLIGQIDCGSKLDSIMMRILRSAMDKAHEKLQFKDRPIEFLHEQTIFHELAAILVEGGLKIVEDESEILESSSRSKFISDLIEIRERLVGRIRKMKRLIMEKDREFRERVENELRLREALELTERESVHLYEKIGPGLMKMKDSVDEQVLNIKRKLEDEKMILSYEIRARSASSPNLDPSSLDKGRRLVMLEDEKMILNTQIRAKRSLSCPNLSSNSLDNERRARRSHSNPNLSIDSLYTEWGLIILEDGKMILNNERGARRSRASGPNPSPDSLNKEPELVMLEDEKMILNTERRARGTLRASSPNLNPDSLGKERGSGIDILKQTLDLVFGRMQLAEVLTLEKQWRKGIKREVESVLMKGFLRDLHTKFDIEVKKTDGLVKDSWFDFIDEMKSLFHELKDFFSRNDVSNVQPSFPRTRRTNSEPNLDINFTQNLLENNGDEEVGGSHHVWKIIKSHESVIRRQREQRSLLTRDALQREGASSWIKRNEDINAMERLIQDAITRLENFTQRKHKVSDLKGVGCRSRAQEKRRIPKPHRRIDRASSTTIQSFEAEIKKLQEERDGLCFQISVIEDTFQLLFRGVMKDFSRCGEKETATDESEGSNTYQMHYMEGSIREDIFVLIFQEMVKQRKMTQSDSVAQEDFRCNPILQDYTESLLREEIYKIYFREMTETWRLEALKQFDFEVHTPQSRVTFPEELVKELKMSQSDPVRGSETPQKDFRCSPILQDCTECLLREEIYKIYLREMTKTWRSSEESKQFDFEARTPQSRRAQEGTPRSRGGDGESSLIHKVDSLLKSLELEEDLMLKASSLIKEHSVSNSLVILNCEEMEERNAIEWLITDDESTFCSVSEKLERALQQLYTSKELLAELEESLEVSDGGGEYYENSQFNNILRLQDEGMSSYLELEDVGEADWSENVLAIIKKFRFLVDDVEVELHENLEGKCLRLEALKRQVDALTQPVAWIKTRKLLYEKAFISRCRNLKLAEAEVDLLGDQVETLLSLLERIYLVLSREARVLSRYFEVYDILKLIKIELNGGRSSKPKS